MVRYSGNLEVGCRWYEANGVEPLFPFGCGLSYPDFACSDPSVRRIHPDRRNPRHWVVSVEFTITNTGDVAGKEAAQVYVTLPEAAGEPAKRLVGFEKVDLEPGESERVSVIVDPARLEPPAVVVRA